MTENVVAIIPARGGSKRIPEKNIVEFCGKPLIAWTIEAAIASNLFEKILVSTDSEKIANISKKYGADVPFLRDKYSDDISSVSLATVKALSQLEKYYNKSYNNVVQLMPNCPIRDSLDIIQAYTYFINNDVKFQISCFKFGWMNPWWATIVDDKYRPEFIFKEESKKRSQDLKDLYCPTGAIWVAKSEDLKNENTFYGDSYIFYPINWMSAIDIDNYEDLEMAEAVLNMKKVKR